MMGTITLAGSSLSRVGAVFRYIGAADECDQCGLKEICHKLKSGRMYKVVDVRKVTHPCQVHSDDKVTVVEVEELPLEASVPVRKALEAALVSLDDPECPSKWCPNHVICTLPKDMKGTKAAIKEVREALVCPRGLKLKKVILEPR